MQKQILAHWLEGFTLAEIAERHNVTVSEVMAAIRGVWL